MLFWTSSTADTPPFSRWQRDSFDDAKGTPLYDALLAIQEVASEPITGVEINSPEYQRDTRTITEIYSIPELTEPILVLLDAVEKTGLDQLPKSVRYRAVDVIIGAVASGKSEFVPVLKRLARSPEVKVRKAVTYGEAIHNSPSPSLAVMKESIVGTLENIPEEFLDTIESRSRVNEFISAVNRYCEFSTLEQRQEIRPLVENFLKKGGSRFEELYRAELEKTLTTKSLTIKPATARETKRTMPTAEGFDEKTVLHSLLFWCLAILAILGFLWVVVKKRLRMKGMS